MESEEREAATGRSRNVVHILPQSMDSVPRFLNGPLERVDPTAGTTQLVVVTADTESAVAMAEAVLRLTGLGGIELFPVTTARRASRLMQGRPVLAIAGAPADLADLIRGTHLKMNDVSTVVLAWADEVFEGDPEATAALELVMTELPKDAARVVVTDRADKRVDAFVERYLRRARRMDEQDVPEDAEPVALRYVTVSPSSRLAALRRLLDELDPPSAAVIVGSAEADAEVTALLRTLGLQSEGAVTTTRGDVPETHAAIFYGMPSGRQQLTAAAAANPVTIIALVQPRELPPLRRMSGGEVKPLIFPNAGKLARDRERALRQELSTVLNTGLPAREILALEPLLDSHDGIEIAAAALRLLERERAIRKNIEAAAAAAAPRPAPPKPAAFERGSRPSREREGNSSRGDRQSRGDRPSHGDRPAHGDRTSHSDRPPRDSRPGDRRPPGQSTGARDRHPGSRPGSGGRPPRDRT